MSAKHQLKQFARGAWARLLFHTGAHRILNRLTEPRLTILFGHCLEDASNRFLPSDMKMREETLRGVVSWFQKRGYPVTNIAEGLEQVEGGTSAVALSLDDGYKDNRTRVLPVLSEMGASATVFLESRPLDERRVNWSHKYHWVIADADTEMFVRGYLAKSKDKLALEKLRVALEEGQEKLAYRAKLVFKYDAEPADRDRVIDEIFREAGGDEQALCEELYMTWEDTRELRDGGVELGGHTVSHPILSRLEEAAALAEIGHCRERMVAELGEDSGRTFAYPFGRRWDYGEETLRATRQAGFSQAVNTHAGTNSKASDRLQLARLPVDDTTPLHLLVAHACGGFEFLRKFGLDLRE